MKMSIVITCICAVVAVSMAAMNGNGGYNIMNMGMNGMNMGMNGMNMGMNQNWAWNSNMMNRLMNMNQNWNMNNGWNNMRNSMARRDDPAKTNEGGSMLIVTPPVDDVKATPIVEMGRNGDTSNNSPAVETRVMLHFGEGPIASVGHMIADGHVLSEGHVIVSNGDDTKVYYNPDV